MRPTEVSGLLLILGFERQEEIVDHVVGNRHPHGLGVNVGVLVAVGVGVSSGGPAKIVVAMWCWPAPDASETNRPRAGSWIVVPALSERIDDVSGLG
jgi:hypothetical protein